MWYESMEAQRRFFQLLCEWWMPDCRWADRLCEPPPFGISSIRSGERAIPVVESVVDRTPFCELRHFARAEGATAGKLGQASGTAASIFVCAPLAGHHAVMLREMVETLLQNGDVYVTDRTDARDMPLAAGRASSQRSDNCVGTGPLAQCSSGAKRPVTLRNRSVTGFVCDAGI
jgi:poly(3-hydroxybutyrate) depolymerase